MPGDTEPHRIRCVCDIVVWEDVLNRGRIISFAPFSAVRGAAVLDRCHLCSLLYGSLKAYHPQEGYTKLTDDCPCTAERDAFVHIYGESDYIGIQVSCGGPEEQMHMAILQLSTKPHNRRFPMGSMEQQSV